MKQEPRFIKQLFDTNFDHFITRKVARVFYTIWIVLIVGFSALGSLILIGSGQAQGFETLAILLGPLVGFLLLILVRLAFETSIALVLIAENTRPATEEQKNLSQPSTDDGKGQANPQTGA